MPKTFPKEFRDDVVAIALERETSFAQIAKDFGISLRGSCSLPRSMVDHHQS